MPVNDSEVKRRRDKLVADLKTKLERNNGGDAHKAEREATRAIDSGAEILERRRRGTIK